MGRQQMGNRKRTFTIFTTLAVTAALLVAASSAVGGARLASDGDGPVAQKSGAIVNWQSGFKLRVAKRIQPLAVCAVACNVTGTGRLKGMGGKATFSDSGTFAAGQLFGLYVTVKGPLLRLMKSFPGRFRLSETLTATDPATGAVDTISRTFRFKR
jgi:hypothetical protein